MVRMTITERRVPARSDDRGAGCAKAFLQRCFCNEAMPTPLRVTWETLRLAPAHSPRGEDLIAQQIHNLAGKSFWILHLQFGRRLRELDDF